MNKVKYFSHYSRGKGRPQIVLVGNGLEYKSGQPSWDALINSLTISNCPRLDPEIRNKIPFPLLYELLASQYPAPSTLSAEDIKNEETRLAKAMKELKNVSNSNLELLPTLNADHIFTTNYSYCIEKAFWPKKDFSISKVRSDMRFNFNSELQDGKPRREVNYRLHSGYLAETSSGKKVGIWHIHGESSVPQGVIVGHDRYGRLLSRMEKICDTQKYGGSLKSPMLKQFTSWPELFLYGDVYIIGLGFQLCEFDLWWLLRRKQRERYADGKVYFYNNSTKEDDRNRDLLMQANGVVINPGIEKERNYDSFYEKALAIIREQIKENGKDKL